MTHEITAAEFHDTHDHIAAVFTGREQVEAAVRHLRATGLGSEHLSVAVRSDDPVVFEHDVDAEQMRSSGIAAAIGTPIGILAGIALAAAAVPGLAVGGFLALAGIGAGWGALLGGLVGLSHEGRAAEEHASLAWSPLHDGEVLLVVCSHGEPEQVHAILTEHGGRITVVQPR